MRLASILSERDLPSAELQAAVLDGELTRVGEAFCPIDTIVNSRQRAGSLAAAIPSWSIAERHTAGWVYGLIERLPDQLQLCVDSHTKLRPFSTRKMIFREVVLEPIDTVALGELTITTPLRTAIDIARVDEEFTTYSANVVRGLAEIGSGFTIEHCAMGLSRRRNLPNKRLALARLTAALCARTATQPALTRYTS